MVLSETRMGGTVLYSRGLSYWTPFLRNKLPTWVQESEILSVFKIRLKTVLFDKVNSLAGSDESVP